MQATLNPAPTMDATRYEIPTGCSSVTSPIGRPRGLEHRSGFNQTVQGSQSGDAHQPDIETDVSKDEGKRLQGSIIHPDSPALQQAVLQKHCRTPVQHRGYFEAQE